MFSPDQGYHHFAETGSDKMVVVSSLLSVRNDIVVHEMKDIQFDCEDV